MAASTSSAAGDDYDAPGGSIPAHWIYAPGPSVPMASELKSTRRQKQAYRRSIKRAAHALSQEEVEYAQNNYPRPTVVNVVVAAETNCTFDLLELCGVMRLKMGCCFKTTGFATCSFQVTYRPNALVLIFATGKVLCIGGRTRAASRECMRIVLDGIMREMPDKYGDLEMYDIQLHLMVAATRLSFPVDLRALSTVVENMSYEPDNFPGGVWPTANGRNKDLVVTFLVFEGSPVNITSARVTCEVTVACDWLIKTLLQVMPKKGELPHGAAEGLLPTMELGASNLSRFNMSKVRAFVTGGTGMGLGVSLPDVYWQAMQWRGGVLSDDDDDDDDAQPASKRQRRRQ